jgi:hypothetical protein
MNKVWKIVAAVVLLFFAALARADDRGAPATIQFTLAFPGANPSHYEITVGSDGHGVYTSDGELSQGASSDPQPLEFTPSEKTRQEIFDLAKKSHYFSGNVDSGRSNLANTGSKTLTYKDDSHHSSATYNYSSLPAIQQLTAVFQDLSTVLEYGRRLSYFHKYQKLALEDDLKQMEDRQRENNLGDVQAIAPVLKEVADDSSVMRMTRARALRLLASAGK